MMRCLSAFLFPSVLRSFSRSESLSRIALPCAERAKVISVYCFSRSETAFFDALLNAAISFVESPSASTISFILPSMFSTYLFASFMPDERSPFMASLKSLNSRSMLLTFDRVSSLWLISSSISYFETRFPAMSFSLCYDLVVTRRDCWERIQNHVNRRV